jgi:hypothetical protein
MNETLGMDQNSSQASENRFKQHITSLERKRKYKMAFVLLSIFQKKSMHVPIEIKGPNLNFSELAISCAEF